MQSLADLPERAVGLQERQQSELRREQASAGELGPGDVFGLFSGAGHAAGEPRVVAVTDCEVTVIDAGAAAEVIGRDAALSSSIEQIVSERRRRTHAHLDG